MNDVHGGDPTEDIVLSLSENLIGPLPFYLVPLAAVVCWGRVADERGLVGGEFLVLEENLILPTIFN